MGNTKMFKYVHSHWQGPGVVCGSGACFVGLVNLTCEHIGVSSLRNWKDHTGCNKEKGKSNFSNIDIILLVRRFVSGFILLSKSKASGCVASVGQNFAYCQRWKNEHYKTKKGEFMYSFEPQSMHPHTNTRLCTDWQLKIH